MARTCDLVVVMFVADGIGLFASFGESLNLFLEFWGAIDWALRPLLGFFLRLGCDSRTWIMVLGHDSWS